MIIRKFHPVGQGAFYSEKHEDINVVYDCGSMGNKNLASKIVGKSFNRGEQIDVLFISHFDEDHVNLIGHLKSKFPIKKVVMPLLHKNEKQLILAFARANTEEAIIGIVDNPENFFGEETKIIQINTSRELEGRENNEEINIDDSSSGGVKSSGIRLIHNDWVYIPHNLECDIRRPELDRKLEQEGLDLDHILYDPDYVIRNRTKLKSVYKAIRGYINQNSLVVYSGPYRNKNTYYCKPCFGQLHCCHHCCWEYKNTRVGCVYTGDFDLNAEDIRTAFPMHWNNVGTIQIPHHGSRGSFSPNIFSHGYRCPISFGSTNQFGHPSSALIDSLLRSYCKPIFVTEKLDSIYTECIEY